MNSKMYKYWNIFLVGQKRPMYANVLYVKYNVSTEVHSVTVCMLPFVQNIVLAEIVRYLFETPLYLYIFKIYLKLYLFNTCLYQMKAYAQIIFLQKIKYRCIYIRVSECLFFCCSNSIFLCCLIKRKKINEIRSTLLKLN